MTAPSIGRLVLPALALVAATGAAIAFGITYVRRAPPPETTAAAIAPTVSRDRDENSTTLSSAKAQASAVATHLGVSSLAPAADASVPVFDVARIERSGDAVIAGRAAPGATVELMRDGERLDGAVADQSGQFVMVPPQLPRGNYELILRARLPDGTFATSKQGVAVALDDAPSTGALQSRAEAPFTVPDTAPASQARRDVAVSQPSRMRVASAGPDAVFSPAVVRPKMLTRVVSRGDSLWRISRLSYGDGQRYVIVYNANRERIQDPDRIYPGQIFVIPRKVR